MEFIANDYFLIVHDEQTGKIRIQERVAGIGLAGALLGELALTGNIRITQGKISVVHPTPPGDDLADRVLHQITAEAHHQDVRTWLRFLSEAAANRVGTRLARTGLVTPIRKRRLAGSVVRYVSTDLNASGRPAMRLSTQLGRDFPTSADAMLTGLVAATGLSRRVWWDNDSLINHHVQTTVASLPMSLRELLAHTEAAVGDAVLGTNM